MRGPGPRRGLAAALVALSLAGCRLHVQRITDGVPPDPAKLERLAASPSTVDDALRALGAPDRVEWTEGEDVLVFDSLSIRSSRFEVENPSGFVGGNPSQSLVGEGVRYVLFVAERTGRALPARSPQGGAAPAGPRFTQKPLTLDGDALGHESVRLVFDRESRLLARIEVIRGRPEGGIGGVAKGTFLK